MNARFNAIDPADLSQRELHHLLLSVVAPRPIALVSTINENGTPNLSPFSFFNIFSSRPPVLIFSPAIRAVDNTKKHTLDNISQQRECVVHIVQHDILEQMSLSSMNYPEGVNEFVKAGFTMLDSVMVKPPRAAEAAVAMECRLRQLISLGDQGGAGQLVICDIQKIHLNRDYLQSDGTVDLSKLRLVGRMGGDWYVNAFGDALVKVDKPGRQLGIGFDQLPAHLLNSDVLTGNELARLAGLMELPSEAEVASVCAEYQAPKTVKKCHMIIKNLIAEGDFKSALSLAIKYDEHKKQ